MLSGREKRETLMPQQGISNLSIHRTVLNQLSHFDWAFPHSLYSHISLQYEFSQISEGM